MSSKKDKACEYFNEGYNCSQAVLGAFSNDLGITMDMALEIASELGGGTGRDEICGAVKGAIKVLELKNRDNKSSEYINNLTNDFIEKFKKKNNAIKCKELLGYDISQFEELKQILEKDLFKSVCPCMVIDAVDILEK